MEVTTILKDDNTVGKRQREEESMKKIDFYDKNPDHIKAKARSQSVRLESNKHLDKNPKEQATQKGKTFTINDNKDINNDKISFSFVQGPLKPSEETKMKEIDKNIESCSDVEEKNSKEQKQSKIINRTKSNSVRMERSDNLLKEKRKTFDVNSGQFEILKVDDSKLKDFEDRNLSEGGDSDLENEMNSSSDESEESFEREEEEKQIKEKDKIKQRGKYYSLIQPKDEEDVVDERKRNANTNFILKKESESDNKAESSIEKDNSIEKLEEDFEFESSNEKQKPKFKSLFLSQNDSIEIAKKRQSFNEKAIIKPSKFKNGSRAAEQSTEEKVPSIDEEKVEKKPIKSRNNSNSVVLINEEINQNSNKNSGKFCILNSDSISDKRIAFDLKQLKELKDQTLNNQINKPMEKQENQQKGISKIVFLIKFIYFLLELIEKEKDDSSKKSRNKSNSVIITSVNLQNIKPSSISRKTVAIFANNENDKFNEYLNNINEKSLDFEEIKKNAERKSKGILFKNDLRDYFLEEEPDVREKDIENIKSKRKIEHKFHSLLISEEEQKKIEQNFNRRKTIASSCVSSNKFHENNLHNNINHKEEEIDPNNEREGTHLYGIYTFILTKKLKFD